MKQTTKRRNICTHNTHPLRNILCLHHLINENKTNKIKKKHTTYTALTTCKEKTISIINKLRTYVSSVYPNL